MNILKGITLPRIAFALVSAATIASFVYGFVFQTIGAIVLGCVMALLLAAIHNDTIRRAAVKGHGYEAEIEKYERERVETQAEIQQTVEDVVKEPTDREAVERLITESAQWGWHMRPILSTPPKPVIKWEGDKPTILFGEGTEPKPPRRIVRRVGRREYPVVVNEDGEGDLVIDQWTSILGPERRP